MYTEEVNKISLSSNDDKRIQTFDKVTTYPHGINAFMVCKNEMLLKNKFIDSKSQSLIDKSQVLRKESQARRKNSLLLGNKLKELRAASHDTKNKSYILRTESQILRNKSAKNEIEKEIKVIREEYLQIIDISQKSIKSDNDNSKLQVIINVNDKNKDTNKKHTVKNKSDLLNKMSDNNILSTKNLLQDRRISNYMGMILKKIIWEQFNCGKFYTIKSNKNRIIIQPRNRSLKNIKITMRKEEIFIHIEKNF